MLSTKRRRLIDGLGQKLHKFWDAWLSKTFQLRAGWCKYSVRIQMKYCGKHPVGARIKVMLKTSETNFDCIYDEKTYYTCYFDIAKLSSELRKLYDMYMADAVDGDECY